MPNSAGMRRAALLALLVVMAGSGWWGWRIVNTPETPQTARPQPPVTVTVASVQRRDVPQDARLVGAVYPYMSVAVKARLDSQVTAVLFHDGDLVKEGDVLFRLDDRALLAQRTQLEANIARDTVQLTNARATLERSQQLMKQGFVTHEKLEQDKTAFEAQRAELAASRAALESTQVQLDYATIHAPITGRVGTIAATLGNNVKNNDQPLVTINQIDPVLVQAAVPQRYFDQLKQAMVVGPVNVTASRAQGPPMTGALEYIDNAIDQSNGTFIIRARFANPQERLWPGMFVETVIALGAVKNALTVPTPAIQGSADQHFIFVADPKTSSARLRPVQIGEQNDQMTIITQGAQEGEQVIIDGFLRLTDGAPIAISSPKQVAP